MAKKKYYQIGAAWAKKVQTAKGVFEFISLAFQGKREKDQFEVILRDKATNQEYKLYEMGVSLIVNSYKKENSNQPDYNISVGYEE